MPGGYPLGLELCNGTDIGTNTGTGLGTSVSLGTNAVGSWTSLITTTVADACWMVAVVQTAFNTATECAVDIGIGGSGSQVVIAQQLWATGGGNQAITTYPFPCNIPSGTHIWARGQANAAGDVSTVQLQLFDGAFTQLEGCAGLDSIGFTAATTLGTAITPNVSANIKGSYAALTSSAARDYIGFLISFGPPSQGTSMGGGFNFMDIAIGGAGSEKNIVSNLWFESQGQSSFPQVWGPVFIPIKSGTRVSARVACNGSVGPVGVVMYGIYQ